MKKRTIVALLLVLVMLLSLAACTKPAEPAPANNDPQPSANEPEKVTWPTGQVEIVVPAKAGGSQDVRARVTADYLQRKYGVTVVVNNMGEGNGVTGIEYVRNAKPDGSVLLYNYTGNMDSMYFVGKYDYNPLEALTPIIENEFWGANAMVSPKNWKYNTWGEAIKDLKANGGTVTVGAQLGSLNQAKMTAFAKAQGVNFEVVETMTASDKITAMSGGFVDMTFLPIATAVQYQESGDLKIIGVSGGARDPLFPDYETTAEQGYELTDLSAYSRVYAPGGMDPELARAINEALCGAKDDATTLEQMKNLGSTYPDTGFCCVDWDKTMDYMKKSQQSVIDAVKAAGTYAR